MRARTRGMPSAPVAPASEPSCLHLLPFLCLHAAPAVANAALRPAPRRSQPSGDDVFRCAHSGFSFPSPRSSDGTVLSLLLGMGNEWRNDGARSISPQKALLASLLSAPLTILVHATISSALFSLTKYLVVIVAI